MALQISSVQNVRIKHLLKLQSQRRYRDRNLEFTVEGAREISRALASGYELLGLYVCREVMSDEAQAILGSLPESSRGLLCDVSKPVYQKLVLRDSSDGLLAVLRQRTGMWSALDGKSAPLVLIVEAVEKPGNLGALLRTADGAGVDAVIVLDSRIDVFNPNCIRASLGAIFAQTVIVDHGQSVFTECRQRGLRLVAASPDGKSLYYDAVLSGGVAIVLGSEAHGLSERWQKEADELVVIPMCGVADSLNVSVAGGVMLYEALRQRR